MTEVPILIYQMGKVGSSSLTDALEATGRPVFQVHVLNQKTIDWSVEQHLRHGTRFPSHLKQSCLVWKDILKTGCPVKIITAVRDPIARNISAYFQNLGVFREQKQEFEEEELTAMLDQFLAEYSHHLPLGWFEREMNSVFSLNVYSHPFPQSNGVHRILEKEVDILILKAEAEDSAKVTAVREFIGDAEFSLKRTNVTANKRYQYYYSSFLNRLRLPQDYVDKMYFSRYSQHFYSPQEIDRFRGRWLGTRSQNSPQEGVILRKVS